jgi:hypothetical protein
VAKVNVAMEIGSKRAFASALDWPGWSRGGKTPELALEALETYAKRYERVAKSAAAAFPARRELEVVERQRGDASTDYGVPGSPARLESEPMTKAEVERMCSLVEACWHELDRIAKAAPLELRLGPRGGGRNRDKMLAHVIGAEASAYAPKLGLKIPEPAIDDRKAINAMRRTLIDSFRRGADGKPLRERGWPVRYAARRIAWHALDHAWEMEDRSDV